MKSIDKCSSRISTTWAFINGCQRRTLSSAGFLVFIAGSGFSHRLALASLKKRIRVSNLPQFREQMDTILRPYLKHSYDNSSSDCPRSLPTWLKSVESYKSIHFVIWVVFVCLVGQWKKHTRFQQSKRLLICVSKGKLTTCQRITAKRFSD